MKMDVGMHTLGTTGPIDVESINHRYVGAEEVLIDVSLHVPAGCTVALLGPSGCGKTTLLRSIAGLERPDSGSISIDGRPVVGPSTWIPAERRRVGMVFQDWALFPHMSVGKNVAYGLRRNERDGATIDRSARVAESLELVGLADLADRMPSTLSGGQQQRVALARALAPRPQVLLLDEPFSNFDSGLRSAVRSEVHRLLHEVGITSIFVTHDQEEAFVLGDQVAVMQEGRIVQVDIPQALYESPASRWLAEFVGDGSLYAGIASGAQVTTPVGELSLEAPHRGPVDVLLRPEQLSLTDGNSAEVEFVEFYGHDSMVHILVDGQPVRVRTGPHPDVRRGDRVGVTFTGSSVRAFAAADQ